MYRFFDYLDSIQPQLEFWGQISFWSAMLFIGIYAYTPKRNKEKVFTGIAKENLAMEIRKHG